MFYHDLALMISSSKSKKIPSSSTIIFPVISSIWICWSPSSDIITTTASTTNPGFLQSKNTRNTYQYTNDIQWSSGLHPRNLGRAKDAREVGIDSFRFLQRTQTCTLDLLGRFIYIYIIFANTVSSCSSEQTNFRAGIILLSINWGWALQTHCSAGGLRDCHSLPC